MATFPTLDFPLAGDSVQTHGDEPRSLGVAGQLFGRGLMTPFRRDKQADFASANGSEVVKSALGQILGTRADDGNMTGELPWRHDFGSLLHLLQYMNVDEAFGAMARSRVVGALSIWEPRVRVRKIGVMRQVNTRGEVTAVIRVSYDIVQASTGSILLADEHVDVPAAA